VATQYSYDNQRLTSVRHDVNGGSEYYEVFCYRLTSSGGNNTTPDNGCSTSNPWTPNLQWKAKSSSQTVTSATWSEAVAYTYGTDGTVTQENYLLPAGVTRKTITHQADAQRRPTYDYTGTSGSGYANARFYDRADNLAGVGMAYNFAVNGFSALCNGSADAPGSQLCVALGYDRANRLATMDEHPDGGIDVRTCWSYDDAGNPASVTMGGSVSGATCSGGETATYKYDDFGNVVSASPPWYSGTTPTTLMSYDAMGNMLFKQTPAMQGTGGALAYGYDGLGRQTSLKHVWARSSSEPLNSTVYDTTTSTPPGDGGWAQCGDGGTSLPSAAGRPVVRTDSFGQTWRSLSMRMRQRATEFRLLG
jgi:hypothetical protein